MKFLKMQVFQASRVFLLGAAAAFTGFANHCLLLQLLPRSLDCVSMLLSPQTPLSALIECAKQKYSYPHKIYLQQKPVEQPFVG